MAELAADDFVEERTETEMEHDAIYWPIADQLVREGKKKPTQEDIRQRCPTGGSYSYIGPSLKRWRKRSKSTVPHIMQEDLPEEMKIAQAQATATLWRAASALANDRIRRIDENTQERIKEAEGDEAENRREIARLEAELKTRDATIQQRDQDNLALQGQIKDLGEHLAGAKATIESLKTHCEELAQERKAAQDEAATWKGQAGNLAELLKDSEAKLKTMTDTQRDTAGALQKAQVLADERKERLDTYDQKLEEQRKAYEALLRDKASAEATAKLTGDELASLRGQMQELSKIHTECTGKIARAEAQAEERGAEVGRLRTQVEALQSQVGEKSLALADETRKLQDAEALARKEAETRQALEKELAEVTNPNSDSHAHQKPSKGNSQKSGKD